MFDGLIYRTLDKIVNTCNRIREWLIKGHYLKVRVLMNGRKRMPEIMMIVIRTLINNNEVDYTDYTNTTNMINTGEKSWTLKL